MQESHHASTFLQVRPSFADMLKTNQNLGRPFVVKGCTI